MPTKKQDLAAGQIMAAAQVSDWAGTVRISKKTLRKNRFHLEANRMLGFALYRLGETDAAFEAYRRATVVLPSDAELLVNYANLLIERARHFDAAPLLEKVCEIRPEDAIGWIKLSEACYLIQRHEKGFMAAEKGAEYAKNVVERTAALTQKAIHRRELGQVHEAVLDCEAAIALKPDEPGNHTNRLLFMLADPSTDPRRIPVAAREFSAVFEAPLKPYWPSFANHQRNPWSRLKIGFLSPDFRNHAAMYFCEGLLAQLDRRQFEVFAFHIYPKEDFVTNRIKRHVDRFISLSHLELTRQISIIKDNNIDILIDMAGHTGHNGLSIMMRKPAPLQASWLGFIATTGLEAIDYYITDNGMNPPGAETLFTESLYRLPTGTGVYRPMCRNPLWRYQPRYVVQATPAIKNGYITFGSCNNLGKITDTVLLLWAEILKSVKKSRLLIEGKGFNSEAFFESYKNRCENLGIDKDRLELVNLDPSNQYLTYHRIDIALDPFPLNGGTTTADTLWMGVPLVALEGFAPPGRMASAALTQLGRTEWIASTTSEYANIAVTLAGDIEALNALRLGLRREVEQSTVMREDIFAHFFGEALRSIWLRWLAKEKYPDDEQDQSKAISSWLELFPKDWAVPEVPGVGLAQGKRVSLHEAHIQLQQLVELAKHTKPKAISPGVITDKCWTAVTELSEVVLSSVPNDPVALACLAEVEHAHGHTEFAVTYLKYASDSMNTS